MAALAETVSSYATNGGDSLYRAVVDTAVDATVVIDRAGTIRSVNKATERVFGYSADELTGRNVNMLMPEPFAREHDGYLASYLGTGVKKIIGIGREVAGRREDGSVFPMELSVGEARDAGEPIFVGITRDITERKAAESALRERSCAGARSSKPYRMRLSSSMRTVSSSHSAPQPSACSATAGRK